MSIPIKLPTTSSISFTCSYSSAAFLELAAKQQTQRRALLQPYIYDCVANTCCVKNGKDCTSNDSCCLGTCGARVVLNAIRMQAERFSFV